MFTFFRSWLLKFGSIGSHIYNIINSIKQYSIKSYNMIFTLIDIYIYMHIELIEEV